MDLVDMFLLLALGLTAFLVVFFMIVLKRQAQAMRKFDHSLRNQEMVLKRFDGVIKELRQANRFLSELASAEWTDEAPPVAHAIPHRHDHRHAVETHSDQCAMHDHVHTDEENPLNAANSSSNEHKLYVGNIDYAVTEAELAEHFGAYGEVEGANIPINRYNGRARGFGFVTFVSREEAEKAIVLNGTAFKGRQIQVNFAKERESNS